MLLVWFLEHCSSSTPELYNRGQLLGTHLIAMWKGVLWISVSYSVLQNILPVPENGWTSNVWQNKRLGRFQRLLGTIPMSYVNETSHFPTTTTPSLSLFSNRTRWKRIWKHDKFIENAYFPIVPPISHPALSSNCYHSPPSFLSRCCSSVFFAAAHLTICRKSNWNEGLVVMLMSVSRGSVDAWWARVPQTGRLPNTAHRTAIKAVRGALLFRFRSLPLIVFHDRRPPVNLVSLLAFRRFQEGHKHEKYKETNPISCFICTSDSFFSRIPLGVSLEFNYPVPIDNSEIPVNVLVFVLLQESLTKCYVSLWWGSTTSSVPDETTWFIIKKSEDAFSDPS